MSVEEVLTEAIGEEAANKAVYALYRAAEQRREDRPNIHIIIDISHLGEFTWGKVVSRFTRSVNDNFYFDDHATNS